MRRLLEVLQKDIVNVWNMDDPENVGDDSCLLQRLSLILHRSLVS